MLAAFSCIPIPANELLLFVTPAVFYACRPQVQVAFTVVRYQSEAHGERQGVATSWLHRLCDPVARGAAPAGAAGAAGGPLRLPIFLRRGGAFGPPDSPATPLVMIGPGTGVAPFRGFLQHRAAQLVGGAAGPRGQAWLFFGCRRRDHDFLYGEDLEVRGCLFLSAVVRWVPEACNSSPHANSPCALPAGVRQPAGVAAPTWFPAHPTHSLQGFAADGTLDRLHVAFSRAQVRLPGLPVTRGPCPAGHAC